MVVTIKVERGRKSASPPQILGSERGWKGDVDMLSRIDVMSTSRVSLNGEGDTYLSILGIIAIVRVVGVGNKVEWGVILEECTCIQQRARMLSGSRFGWSSGKREGRETHLPGLLEFLATGLAGRTTVEGAIVFGQRALRAEPPTASAVAAIKIITRTECHCACPTGTTSKGERDPIRSPRQQTAFITEFAPKKGTLSSASSALTCPNEE